MKQLKDFTPEELQAAREHVADKRREHAAASLLPDYGYASHVTDERKQYLAQRMLDYADQIQAGKQDHNLTIAQRMHYFLTGDSAPILAK
jgi:hypothetical protein